jgi:hypothetical protein
VGEIPTARAFVLKDNYSSVTEILIGQGEKEKEKGVG